MKKKVLLFFLLVVVMAISVGAFASCKGKKQSSSEPAVDYGEDGVYYCDTVDGELNIQLNDDAFTWNFGGATANGSYTYDGRVLTFNPEGGAQVVATLKEGVLDITYGDVAYKFLEKIEFTVTFYTYGSDEVVNGRTVAKPADPEKEDCIFVGWYKESSLKNKFDFTEPITGDTTLYARFVVANDEATVFTASLVVDGAPFDTVQTVNGVLYNLPVPTKEGAEFAGWWVSHSGDANKLTYKYEEQVLAQNETLYAVWKSESALVSVDENGVNWESTGVGNSYHVKVTDPDGVVSERTQGTTSYDYDFSDKKEGEYVVEVTVNGNTTTVYYVNKALAKVSLFTVDGFVLVWNPVENAEEYLLTIECAESSHTHVEQSNENKTTFDFANCGMKEGGIKFTVTAVADGFVTSVSEQFVLERNLAAVAALNWNDNAQVTWDAVENAQYYAVTVNGETVNVNDTFVDLRNYGVGEVNVSVVPVAAGYNSPAAAVAQYNKTTLAAPTGVALDSTVLRWNEVEGATGYVVTVNGVDYTAATNSFELTNEHYDETQESCTVEVKAVGATAAQNSVASYGVTIYFGNMSGTPVYNNGVVTWQPALNVSKFEVKVGSAAPVEVAANVTEYAVTFTADGEQTVSVRCYNKATGAPSEWISVNVTVYKVTFDVTGGAALDTDVKVQYKAKGDTMVVPETEKLGYTFDAWYNAKTDGAKLNGTTFDGDTNMTYYAYWNANPYNVKLVATYNNQVIYSETVTVYYGTNYNLGTVESLSANEIYFGGWYAEENGQGLRYTDINGDSIAKWDRTLDITLYADWIEVLQYQEIKAVNGIDTVYQVTKGADIGSVTEITIPATFNGKPVTTVAASAFENCTKLTKIRIPNTIINIEVNNGGNYTGSAFKGCSKLTDVEIYEVEGGVLPTSYYDDIDGVLIYYNEFTGVELKYYPLGRKGDLVVPNGVTALPIRVFRGYSFSKITIPATVVNIDAGAFESSSVSELVFLEPEEGETASPLIIGEKTFNGCSKLVSITLPARVADFDVFLFDSCANLQEINVVAGSTSFSSKQGILCSADGTTILYVPNGVNGEFTIPDGVTTIGEKAFSHLAITRLIVPGMVTEIGYQAFLWCEELTEVVFQGTSTDPRINIATGAFVGCSNLTEITFPENTGIIAEGSFTNCSKLLTVTVNAVVDANNPDELALFGFESDAFYYAVDLYIGPGCPAFDINGAFGIKLRKVIVDPANPYIASDADGVLFNKAMTEIIYYPNSRLGAYVIPDTVEVIGAAVFKEKLGLDKITINWKIKEIGESAFYGCDRLSEIIFEPTPAGEEEIPLVIGDSAFAWSWGGEIPELPSRTVEIGAEAFFVWQPKNGITIPEGVVTIGEDAFRGNYLGGVVTIPSTVTSLGDNGSELVNFTSSDDCITAFVVHENNPNYMSVDGALYRKDENGNPVALLRCPGGKTGTITIPSTVTHVYKYAFYYSKINEIKWAPREATDEVIFEQQAFYQIRQATNVELPLGLKNIVKNSLYYATAVETLVIPYTVETIESTALYLGSSTYPSALTSLVFQDIPDGASVADYPLTLGNSTSNSIFGTGSTRNTIYANIKSVVVPERTVTMTATFYGMSLLESVTLPTTLTTIGQYTFNGCYALEDITFTSVKDTQLTTIGTAAFRYAAIESIYLPDTVTSFGSSVFRDCPNLHNIYAVAADGTVKEGQLPAGVKTVPNYTFADSSLTKFVANESTTLIDQSAFINVTELESVTFLGNKLTEFDSYAFYNCSSLKSIVIPYSITKVGIQAFADCTSLESVEFAVNSKGESAIKTFNEKAFMNTRIKNFVFPESSNTITLGANMFMYCADLETVHICSKISSIAGLFNNCAGLTTVTIAMNNANLVLGEGELPVIYNKAGDAIRFVYSELAVTDGVYTIPAGVTTIGDSAFKGQTGITKLVVPATVTSIGASAFANCVNLKEVVFEESTNWNMSSIGANAFQNCVSLTTVTNLPASVTTLGNYCFEGCKSLITVHLPSVTNTGTYTFQDCTALETVTFGKTSVTFGTYAFANSGITSINVSRNVANYTFYNCANLETVTFNQTGVTSIGKYAFQYCSSLESISLPATVKTFGVYSFNGSGLKSFEFTNADAVMGSYMFGNCENLASVKLPENLAIIPYGAFSHCSSLTAIEIPATVTSLRTRAFEYCGLKEVTIPESITVFDYVSSATSSSVSKFSKTNKTETFQYCTDLEKVTLHEKFKQLGAYSFNGCEKLTEVVGSEHIAEIGSFAFAYTGLVTIDISGADYFWHSAFEGCKYLTDVTFNDDMVDLSQYAFRYCESLKTVTLPSALVKIYNSAFQYCYGLESIVIPKNVTKVDQNAFSYSPNLKEVVFEGKSVEVISQYAFAYCTALKSISLPESVSNIMYNAFEGSGIESFYIGKAISDIGREAFAGCPNLTEFVVSEDNEIYKAVDGILFDKSSNVLYIYPAGKEDADGVYTIPEDVPYISTYAFVGATHIKEIVLNDAATLNIGNQFFRGSCIEKVVLSDVYTEIGQYTFADCYNLKEVVLPENLEKWTYNNSFENCTSLESITLPKKITNIPSASFKNSGLKSIVLPEGVTKIGASAFEGCENLESIYIGTKVYEIGGSAFFGSGLKNIYVYETNENGEMVVLSTNVLPESLLTIGVRAFEGIKITSISLPDSLTTYAVGAFAGCTELTSVKLSANAPEISESMFENATSLTAIDLTGITNIGKLAFAGSGLKSVTIPVTVTTLGKYQATNTSAKPYNDITDKRFSSHVFENCTALETVTFKHTAEDLLLIGAYTFAGCTSLKEVVLPARTEIIAEKAFADCTALNSVTLPTECRVRLGSNVFENCTSITQLYVAGNVVCDGTNVFAGWTNAQTVNFEASNYAVAGGWLFGALDGTGANFVYNYVKA